MFSIMLNMDNNSMYNQGSMNNNAPMSPTPAPPPYPPYPPNPNNTNPNPKGHNTAKIVLIVLAVIVAIGLAVGAYFFGIHGKDEAVANARKQATAEQLKKDEDKARALADDKVTPSKSHTAPTCNADELTLILGEGKKGAESTDYPLTFRNSGQRRCTLEGYPGISLVNTNGNMVGQPAGRVKGSAVLVTLEPSATAVATITMPSSKTLPKGECVKEAVKLRAYPPNDTGYVSVATPTITEWCPGFKTTVVKTPEAPKA